MNNNLFTGKLTRLVAADPDTLGEVMAKWSHDSEFLQLYNVEAVQPRNAKRAQEHWRQELEKQNPGWFHFMLERLEDNRVIGEVGLSNASGPHHNAWVYIGIGERELWSKGYGTDGMNLILGYAFRELNLHRVNLGTFEYNPRAIHAYEKAGFVHEGRMRGSLQRGGKHWDNLYMGILRSEWEVRQNG